MTLPATEDFTAGDYTNIATLANWTSNIVGLMTVSNQCTSYQHGLAHWDADTFSPNQYSEVTIVQNYTYHGMGVAVLCDASTGDGYAYYGDDSASQIIEIVSGSDSTLSSGLSAFANSDVIKLESSVSGSTTTLTAYINDAEEDSTTDTSFTSGYAGVYGQNDAGTQAYIDNWTGDDLAASFTVDQEGYRWRNDDEGEATATWATAAQDATATVNLETNIRLRALINATGDPATANYQLEYRKQGTSDWIKVE